MFGPSAHYTLLNPLSLATPGLHAIPNLFLFAQRQRFIAARQTTKENYKWQAHGCHNDKTFLDWGRFERTMTGTAAVNF